MFGRAITALVTPFKDGSLDETGFASLVDWQITAGTEALVIASLTGEGPTLSIEERDRLIRIAVEVAARRISVLAATGTNSTAGTIALTQQARQAGADSALVVTPYYNRPSQEGILRHFEAVQRSVDLPILIHIQPSHTGADLQPVTLERVAELPGIAGLVDATGDPARPQATARALGEHYPQWCGRDELASVFGASGGHGCVSALGNIVPGLCAALQRACHSGNWTVIRALQLKMDPLRALLGVDADPAGVKQAVASLHHGVDATPRLPLTPCPPDAARRIAATVAALMPFDPGIAASGRPSIGARFPAIALRRR